MLSSFSDSKYNIYVLFAYETYLCFQYELIVHYIYSPVPVHPYKITNIIPFLLVNISIPFFPFEFVHCRFFFLSCQHLAHSSHVHLNRKISTFIFSFSFASKHHSPISFSHFLWDFFAGCIFIFHSDPSKRNFFNVKKK